MIWARAGLAIYCIGTLISMATMSIGVAVLALSALIAYRGPIGLFRRLRNELGNDPHLRQYLLFTNLLTFACFLSLIVAQFFPVTYGGVTPIVEWPKDLWKAWYFYLPLLTVPMLRDLGEIRVRQVLWAWLGGFAILGAIGALQFFIGWPRILNLVEFPGHFQVHGFTGSRLSYASIVIFPFFFLMDETLRKHRRIFLNWLVLAVALFSLAGTFSRMIWLSLPVGILIVFAFRIKKSLRIPLALLIVVICASSLLLPGVRSRLNTSGGISERFTLWKINTEFFKARPITGVGWHHNLELSAGYYDEYLPQDANRFVGHAHSNFFEWIGAVGLAGLCAALAWSGFVLRWAYRTHIGLFAAWIVFHLNGLTQVNFWESKVMHQMMWAVALSLYFVAGPKARAEQGVK